MGLLEQPGFATAANVAAGKNDARVIGQSRLVGTPRCGVRTAQRAVPTIPGPPSLTDYMRADFMLDDGG
jgi:hypothetical protein